FGAVLLSQGGLLLADPGEVELFRPDVLLDEEVADLVDAPVGELEVVVVGAGATGAALEEDLGALGGRDGGGVLEQPVLMFFFQGGVVDVEVVQETGDAEPLLGRQVQVVFDFAGTGGPSHGRTPDRGTESSHPVMRLPAKNGQKKYANRGIFLSWVPDDLFQKFAGAAGVAEAIS